MIVRKLTDWYRVHKRDLPWRDTSDPYRIWVSEVILQQTRVVQGMPYYHRFIEMYPDIFSLAKAETDSILKIWQGLGYYSRARNMHAAARYIVQSCRGKFPETYSELVKIKGIGDYTASAIASIAFNQAVPVIDGNVNRVIARLYGIQQPIDKTEGKKMIRMYAEKLLDKERPAVYNQAIMEFGALQCVPQRPACEACTMQNLCVAYKADLVGLLPAKSRPTALKTRYLHYLVVTAHGMTTYLNRRRENDIWKGLYEFPLIETQAEMEPADLMNSGAWRTYFGTVEPRLVHVSPEIEHRLTHRLLKIRFYEINLHEPVEISDMKKISWQDIHDYAVPKVIENYLAKRG